MYQIAGQDYPDLDSAVAATVQHERCQITQHLKDGVYGYAGQRSVVASFHNGVDLRSLATDEDGRPDPIVRSQSLT